MDVNKLNIIKSYLDKYTVYNTIARFYKTDFCEHNSYSIM